MYLDVDGRELGNSCTHEGQHGKRLGNHCELIFRFSLILNQVESR